MFKYTWVFLTLAVVCALVGVINFGTAPVALPAMFLFAIIALVTFVSGVMRQRPS